MQAYEVEQIPGGMRILATTRPIEHRGMTLNLPTITVEFVAHTPDTISMEAWHYEPTTTKFRPRQNRERIRGRNCNDQRG